MRIVIAPDSFKGSLSARQVARQLKRGLTQGLEAGRDKTPAAKTSPWKLIKLPLADGGEGFVASLLAARSGHWVEATVTGPLGKPVTAGFAWLPPATAVVELAAAAGWGLLPDDQADPWQRTTRGVGELILAALNYGARRIVIGLGGSITHDAGAGLAQALGVGLYREDGRSVDPGARGLSQLARVDLSRRVPRLNEVELLAAHDVNNPLLGPKGAATVYGPQKGFAAAQIPPLEAATRHFARLVEKQTTASRENWSLRPGAGAAGGTGFGLAALLGARLVPGAPWLLEKIGAARQFAAADLIITGEGRMDASSLHDKLVTTVARTAQKTRTPVIAVCGALTVPPATFSSAGIQAIFPIVNRPMAEADAMARAPQLLADLGFSLAGLLQIGFCLHRHPSQA